MRKLNVVLRAIDKISETTGKFASWLMVVATLIVVYEVMARTVFGRSTVWAFDLSIMLWATYIAILLAWTHKEGGHIRVDVFYNRFSTRTKALLDVVFCVLLCFTLIFFLLEAAIDFAAIAWRLREGTGPPWNAPLYPVKTMLPIGLVIFGLQCLARFIRDIMILTGRGE
jgi:TRAP-type mannitol/chloroaromatic compound transport system permease small subunit